MTVDPQLRSRDGLAIVPTKPDKEAVLRRVQEENVLLKRAKGKSYADIGRDLEMTEFQVYKIAMSAMKKAQKRVIESADDVRFLEAKRLDMMLLYLWPQVEKGDTDAIRTASVLMKRRAEMLGIDAPKKIEVEDHREIDVKLLGIIAELRPELAQPSGEVQESFPGGKVPVTLVINSATESNPA
jgi:hypothetical protein